MIGLMLVLLTFFPRTVSISSMGSWYYYKEWAWNLKTKLCCIASGK